VVTDDRVFGLFLIGAALLSLHLSMAYDAAASVPAVLAVIFAITHHKTCSES